MNIFLKIVNFDTLVNCCCSHQNDASNFNKLKLTLILFIVLSTSTSCIINRTCFVAFNTASFANSVIYSRGKRVLQNYINPILPQSSFLSFTVIFFQSKTLTYYSIFLNLITLTKIFFKCSSSNFCTNFILYSEIHIFCRLLLEEKLAKDFHV